MPLGDAPLASTVIDALPRGPSLSTSAGRSSSLPHSAVTESKSIDVDDVNHVVNQSDMDVEDDSPISTAANNSEVYLRAVFCFSLSGFSFRCLLHCY